MAAVLCGCSREDAIKKLSSPQDEAVAKHYIDLMRRDKYDELLNDFDPAIQNNLSHDLFEKIRLLIPDVDPSSVKVVGCKKQVDSYSRTVSTTFEYDYTEEWLLITATVRTLDNTVIVEGIEVHPLPGPLEKNKFTFAGKGPAQYVMFAIFCAVPLLTLFALVLCIRTKMKRKWLWIIFILLGIGRVTMNWTTGDVQAFETQVTKAHGAITYFHPYFAIQLLGAGYVRAPYGPWMLSVSLPLGALVFLYRRRYLQRKTGVPGN